MRTVTPATSSPAERLVRAGLGPQPATRGSKRLRSASVCRTGVPARGASVGAGGCGTERRDQGLRRIGSASAATSSPKPGDCTSTFAQLRARRTAGFVPQHCGRGRPPQPGCARSRRDHPCRRPPHIRRDRLVHQPGLSRDLAAVIHAISAPGATRTRRDGSPGRSRPPESS